MNERREHRVRSDDAAAYALGALEAHEAAEFRAHVESCETCAAELERFADIAAAVPLGATQLATPKTLKRGVMRAVARQAELDRAGSPRISRSPRVSGTVGRWRSSFSRVALSSGVALTAAATLGVILLAPGQGVTPVVIRAQVRSSSAWQATKPVALLKRSGDHGELVVKDLPLTASGKVYELWIERRDVPVPTDALFEPNSAREASVDVPGSLHGAQAVLVTIERAGGAKVPTMAPLIAAQLAA
jgi:anti-sigma-K factor RskA